MVWLVRPDVSGPPANGRLTYRHAPPVTYASSAASSALLATCVVPIPLTPTQRGSTQLQEHVVRVEDRLDRALDLGVALDPVLAAAMAQVGAVVGQMRHLARRGLDGDSDVGELGTGLAVEAHAQPLDRREARDVRTSRTIISSGCNAKGARA